MSNISVVVPVYNVEKYLSRCVESILRQTYTDFDLILVDDGSPDQCGELCEQYDESDNRIHTIHRENGGLSAARNTGIEWALSNSDSEWITFIDSDDWIHPRYLELLYTAVESTGCKVAIVNFERTNGDDPIITDGMLSIKTVQMQELYTDNYMQFITAWGKLYKKAEFKSLRYPEGKLHEDEFTTWKILFKYEKIAVIDAPLYAYYVNEEGITKAKWSSRRTDGLEAQKERIKAIENTPEYAPFREKTLRLTAYTISGYIETLEKEDYPDKKKLISKFRKELRAFLRKYKKEVPFRGYGWAYGKAYPHLKKWFVFRTEASDKIRAKLKS